MVVGLNNGQHTVVSANRRAVGVEKTVISANRGAVRAKQNIIRAIRNTLYGWMIALVCLTGGLAGAHAQAAEAQTILVLGDSLSAAYGIPRERGWVALLQRRLPTAQVINAGISGDTTEGGLARLPALLEKYHPGIVVIELGGNDGLRGFQIPRIRDNLTQLVQLAQRADAKVLLVGMKIPPNYGLRYTSDFYESYTLTAKRFAVPLVPFLLEGIATDPELMQEDRIHPRVEGQQKMLDNIWPALQPLL